MNLATYATEAAIEADHWWFVGRRRLFADIVRRLALPRDAAILDAGSGTGANLRLLRDLGFEQVTGFDFSAEAIRFCAEKGLGEVRQGSICSMPFPDRQFDLVFATDIIEHVDDDLAALREIRRVMKPNGYALVTVPTFPILWGLQDKVSHHKRRYRLHQLLARVRTAGLSPQRYFYFNYLLFLPILAARWLMRILKIRVAAEGEVNTEWLNRVLTVFFGFDVKTAPWLRPPVGVSALVVASRG
jgi:SAM-dependent methyltransferase